MRRARWKRKALCVQIPPFGWVWTSTRGPNKKLWQLGQESALGAGTTLLKFVDTQPATHRFRTSGCKTDLTCFSFRCRSPYRPGSAKRSEERGKRSRGNSITTPKAAPYFQMRGSTRSVPTGSSAPGRRLSAYVGTVSHDSRSSLLDRPAARFLFFARRENVGLAPWRSRTPPRRPQMAHPPSPPAGGPPPPL